MLKNPKIGWAAAGLAVFGLSALLRFWAFGQTPFANGWDSYFYLVQLKSLETTGRMHSPEASLIYPYLRVFYWLTGDCVLAMKVGVALLCGFFTLAAATFADWRQAKNWPRAALLATWALWSPHLTYFAAQYPKNLLGLIFFLAFVRALHAPIGENQPIWRRWARPVFWLALNYFGHRFTFGLAVGYLVLWLFFTFENSFLRKIFTPKNLLALGIFALGCAAASQFFPGLAHWADFGRLHGMLSARPQFAPWSFAQTFGFERIGFWWLLEIALLVGYWAWSLGHFFTASFDLRQRLGWVFCSLLLFPFLEWSLTGLAWRMFLVFVLLVPILLHPRPFARGEGSAPRRRVNRRVPPLAWGAVGVLAAFFSWQSYSPARHDPDYALFARVTANAQRHFASQSPPELVIAHNALAEYFTFTTDTDAMPWLPEYPVDSARLWRIASGVHFQTLKYFAEKENELKINNLGGNYYLLPEFVWQAALKNARAEGDDFFLEKAESWLNPHRPRPVFLLRRKR
jgi:hypothetical protein